MTAAVAATATVTTTAGVSAATETAAASVCDCCVTAAAKTAAAGVGDCPAASADSNCVSACVTVSTCVAVSAVTAADVMSSTSADETMAAPTVAIAPVGPGAYAQKDAVIEVARPIETVGRAGIGWVFVIAVGTDRRRTADTDHDLRSAFRHTSQGRSHCYCTKDYFQSAHLDPFLIQGRG
jgi:hypothetical protein